MDKVIDFEDNNNSNELIQNDLDQNEFDQNEISIEERAYYNSLSSKKIFDFNLLSNNKNSRNKNTKEIKEKNDTIKILYDISPNNKTWKSNRAVKHMKNDGKVKLERRTFNPRPLPPNWDNLRGCVNNDNDINDINKNDVLFPTLKLQPDLNKKENYEVFNESNKIKLPKIPQNPKIHSAWNKMMKKNN